MRQRGTAKHEGIERPFLRDDIQLRGRKLTAYREIAKWMIPVRAGVAAPLGVTAFEVVTETQRFHAEFAVPAEAFKAKRAHVVILNDVAWSIIQTQRGLHPILGFPVSRATGPDDEQQRLAASASLQCKALPTN